MKESQAESQRMAARQLQAAMDVAEGEKQEAVARVKREEAQHLKLVTDTITQEAARGTQRAVEQATLAVRAQLEELQRQLRILQLQELQPGAPPPAADLPPTEQGNARRGDPISSNEGAAWPSSFNLADLD